MAGHRVLREYLDDAQIEGLVARGRTQPSGAWSAGRQGTGYDKLDLLSTERPDELALLIERALVELGAPFIGHDAWLLRYPVGTHIPPHRDEHELGEHHRVNVLLAGPGALRLDGRAVVLRPGDAIVFRPDLVEHAVDAVTEQRWVFSVGAVLERPAC